MLFHCVNIAKVNAWLIYCRYFQQLNTQKNSKFSLLKLNLVIVAPFNKYRSNETPSNTNEIQMKLVQYNTIQYNIIQYNPIQSITIKMKYYPPSNTQLPFKRKNQPTTSSIADDNVADSPEFREEKNKYRLYQTGTGRVYCRK